jgi:gliding motility-associated lipoprotein GldH
MFINLRNNNDYNYSNLFLIVETNFPNGKGYRDTLEYMMTKPSGEFLGTGFSDLKENKLWYREGVVFEESGEYQVNIQHAMRRSGDVEGIQSLEGITDVGLRIEKMPGNN